MLNVDYDDDGDDDDTADHRGHREPDGNARVEKVERNTLSFFILYNSATTLLQR